MSSKKFISPPTNDDNDFFATRKEIREGEEYDHDYEMLEKLPTRNDFWIARDCDSGRYEIVNLYEFNEFWYYGE